MYASCGSRSPARPKRKRPLIASTETDDSDTLVPGSHRTLCDSFAFTFGVAVDKRLPPLESVCTSRNERSRSATSRRRWWRAIFHGRREHTRALGSWTGPKNTRTRSVAHQKTFAAHHPAKLAPETGDDPSSATCPPRFFFDMTGGVQVAEISLHRKSLSDGALLRPVIFQIPNLDRANDRSSAAPGAWVKLLSTRSGSSINLKGLQNNG